MPASCLQAKACDLAVLHLFSHCTKIPALGTLYTLAANAIFLDYLDSH